ncbi:MAG: type VI secretion system lipoprotein TssJ [Ignavibacteriales bacterium]|nr:MAG: type VI secretion system lipoprotein TssJ [Ignavibacteriales bacterium]
MKLIKYIPLLLLIINAAGCGGSSTMMVNMSCDENCNNNNAVVIKIFQLKSADKFRTASFESLLRSPESVLGDDMIANAKYEKLMVPNENFNLNELEIKSDAMFLGIVGDFHSPAKDGWLQVVSLEDGPDELKILIHENSLSVVAE